jgi:hypothetical protein
MLDKSDMSFLMLIGVMVITDNQSSVNVVSAEKIKDEKVKLNLRE